MDNKHQFKDEWIAKDLLQIHSLNAEIVAAYRNKRIPYLTQAAIDGQIATADLIRKIVQDAYQIPAMEFERATIEKMALSLVPEKICRKNQLLPFRVTDENIEVAMANPLDLDAQSDVQAVAGRTVIPYFCLPHKMESLIFEVFNPEAVVYDLLDKIQEEDSVEVLQENESLEHSEDIGTPVIKLVNSLIARAIRLGASDIHIEHEEGGSSVRYRIDGILKNVMVLPKNIAAGAVVSRIKIMSDLDISEHMRPLDGRAKLRVGKNEIGIRVSTLPTTYGEKIVMRLLDSRAAEVPFEKLGFRPEIAERLEKILSAEQGMILMTGPTGSGKTTTLYSMLNKLKSEDTNIVTVEDPIEYKLEGINQVQVNEKQGLNFAAVLRSVLRQDPDIILVGEIRDQQTADIAFQAALTGHLVFSTLHTNDTLSTISRLIDMGIEPFKIAPGLLAITAQRLVRRLCEYCKEPVAEKQADPALLSAFKSHRLGNDYFKSTGCEKCEFTGYKGRLAVIELLEIDQETKDLIKAEKRDDAALRERVLGKGMLYTLKSDALWHLSKGDTSADEISALIHFAETGAKGSQAQVKAEPALFTAASAAPLPAAATLKPAQPPASAPAAGAKRVLITDDDPAIRIILRKYLKEQGYQVEEAEDGQKALEIVSENPPDLLILDFNMPNLDGNGVIRGIRQGLGNLKLPIIMLTSVSDEKSQEDAINLGADDYVIKPFKPPLVVARVNAAFRRIGAAR